MMPPSPRACETEALVWANLAEGGDVPPPSLRRLLRRLVQSLIPTRPATIAAWASRMQANGPV